RTQPTAVLIISSHIASHASKHLAADGYYSLDKPPNSGLGIARMAALLTYRSRNSFESRFGRNFMPQPYVSQSFAEKNYPAASPQKPLSPADASVEHHNDGLQGRTQLAAKRWASCSANGGKPDPQPRVFSAQSYLRHQGENFFKRFDANCYISLTRKLDAHDIARGRPGSYEDVLRGINQAALIIGGDATVFTTRWGSTFFDFLARNGMSLLACLHQPGIESDGLFTISEQYELAEHISDSRMVVINSPEGHDGFLIEFEQVNRHIRRFVQDRLPHLFEASRVNLAEGSAEKSPSGKISGSDRASEAEGGVCAW
ncbi:MAG: homoserine O-acetyltransferase, variant, partial [Olpidium bornovanus]